MRPLASAYIPYTQRRYGHGSGINFACGPSRSGWEPIYLNRRHTFASQTASFPLQADPCDETRFSP